MLKLNDALSQFDIQLKVNGVVGFSLSLSERERVFELRLAQLTVAAVVAFLAVHVSRTLQVAVAITVFVAPAPALPLSPPLHLSLSHSLLLLLLLLLYSGAFFICSFGVAIIFFHFSFFKFAQFARIGP